ncbi:MAG: TetR/AcrR family transcriptional regulator, partial [Pseudomonadota bacterium]|nr:TetR/AcrR family transcriptional regulator [Pseudomonadota bacterium]
MKHFSELTPAATRVLDVAERLIAQRGYNGFSYEDIARRVGIRKPSVHHHFATKAELVAVLAQRYTHRFRTALLEIDGRHGQAPVRLRAYAALFEQTYRRDRELCVCGILGAEAESLPALAANEVARFFGVNLDWLSTTFATGGETGELQLPRAAAVHAQAYLALMEGAMV